MGRSYALLLAAAVVAGATCATGALAADLLPPPPPVEPPPPVDFGGWYLRGDVGVGATQISDWNYSLRPGFIPGGPIWNTHRDLQDTVFAGAGVGYQFNNWLRFDLTGEYRTDAAYRATNHFTFPGAFCPNGTCYGLDSYTANVGTTLFLANAYLDLGTWYGITPFVGGGVGAAFHNLSGLSDYGHGIATGGYGIAADAHPTNFAWAVMGGLGYAVTPNLRLEVGYRYLDMGRITSNEIVCNSAPCPGERQSFNIASHDIRVGFRYLLGGFGPAPIAPAAFAPPPPPPPAYAPRAPLVRKY